MAWAYFKVEGLAEIMRDLDRAPDEHMKAAKKAAKKAASAVQRKIRPGIPPNWRVLLKNKVKKSMYGNLFADVGLYNVATATTRRRKIDANFKWFKAYWANYGTLQRRDPSHKFKYPVRPSGSAAGQRRRNNVGQRHQNFFEKAETGADEAYLEAFVESMREQGYDVGKG